MMSMMSRWRHITPMLDVTTLVQSRSLSTPTLTPIAGPASLGAGRMNARSPDRLSSTAEYDERSRHRGPQRPTGSFLLPDIFLTGFKGVIDGLLTPRQSTQKSSSVY